MVLTLISLAMTARRAPKALASRAAQSASAQAPADVPNDCSTLSARASSTTA